MTYRHGNGIPPAEVDLSKSKAVTFCKIDSESTHSVGVINKGE